MDDTQIGSHTPPNAQPAPDLDDSTQVSKPKLALPPAVLGGPPSDQILEETERSQSTQKFDFDPSQAAGEAPAAAPGYQSAPHPVEQQQGQADEQKRRQAAPIASRSAPKAKGGTPLIPVLAAGALGVATIVVGLAVSVGPLLLSGPPPPPSATPTVYTQPSDTTPPQHPETLYPNGDKLECTTNPVIFRWSPVSDDSGIGGYDIEIDRQVNGEWSFYASAHATDAQTSEVLACDDRENVYRWRVQARDTANNSSGFSPDAEFYLIMAPPTGVPTVALTPPAYARVEVLNQADADKNGGYDFGTQCGDSSIHDLILAATMRDPDGFADVTVEAHYALFDPNHVQIGPETTVKMDTSGDGYFKIIINLPSAAQAVKFPGQSGSIELYLIAMDNLYLPVYYPSADPLDRIKEHIYYGCIIG